MRLREILFKLLKIFIYIIIGTTIFLLILFLYNGGPNLVSACDGAFVSFAIMILLSLFTFLFTRGSFDLIGYAFSTLPSMFNKELDRKYKDLVEYKEMRDMRRIYKKNNFLLPLIASVPFLILAIVLLIIYLN